MSVVEVMWLGTKVNDENFEDYDIGTVFHAPPWVLSPPNGEEVAAMIALDWLSGMDWSGITGRSRNTGCTYRIEICKPAELAGRYVVSCERATTACARQVSPP